MTKFWLMGYSRSVVFIYGSCSERKKHAPSPSYPPPDSSYANWVLNHLGQCRCDQSLREGEQLDRTILGPQYVSALDGYVGKRNTSVWFKSLYIGLYEGS